MNEFTVHVFGDPRLASLGVQAMKKELCWWPGLFFEWVGLGWARAKAPTDFGVRVFDLRAQERFCRVHVLRG